jgi:DNA-binding XRE family transcriptional regulator
MSNIKSKNTEIHVALRRMREAAELSMRQAGALVGISHVAISQFENQKLKLPDWRIEAMLKAYGYTAEDLAKILGRQPQAAPREDCRALIERLSDDQLIAIRNLMSLLVNQATVTSKVAV